MANFKVFVFQVNNLIHSSNYIVTIISHLNQSALSETKKTVLMDSKDVLTLVLLVATLVNRKWCEKSWKVTETLAYGYSSDRTQQELSIEYQDDRV